jgi:hypothetical protein
LLIRFGSSIVCQLPLALGIHRTEALAVVGPVDHLIEIFALADFLADKVVGKLRESPLRVDLRLVARPEIDEGARLFVGETSYGGGHRHDLSCKTANMAICRTNVFDLDI